MKNKAFFLFFLLFLNALMFGQDLHFKLRGQVELRSWRLSNRALKDHQFLNGASVKLYKNAELVASSVSDLNGNFDLKIPFDGDFTIEVAYLDNIPKKFAVSTKSKDGGNSKPTISMVGIIVSKHVKDAKTLGINQPHVQVEYSADKKGPDNKDYNFKSNIYDGEYLMIQKFCTANKLGDLAMEKKNYEQAKGFYMMASNILDSETYPKEQMKKADEARKAEQAIEKVSKKRKNKKENPKQPIVTKQESVPVKKSVDSGKSTRKTRQTLGK